MELKQPLRRLVAVVLMLAGGALMLLSTSVRTGLLVFGLGVLLELIGVALERRAPRAHPPSKTHEDR
jgi:hypothetical protein